MKKQITEDTKQCWNCGNNIFKKRPQLPWSFCKSKGEYFQIGHNFESKPDDCEWKARGGDDE